MAKTKAQKQQILAELEEDINQSKSIVFTKNLGINSEQMVILRKKTYAAQTKYNVVKKTLLKKALQNKKINLPDSADLSGPVNALFSFEDEIIGPKTINDFAKENSTIEIIGGIFEGQYVDQATMIKLANMPSKEELYAKLVGSLNSPISGFVNVLAGNLRNLVGVINAIKDKKESTA
ncbi:MAG: 50S ribosomal protein L10 [Patescibacteria group bacterium]